MENFGDKLRAYLYALLVHAVFVGVLYAGLFWTKATRPIQLQGPVIEAELVGLTAAPRPQPKRHAKPKPAKPKAEQLPKPPQPTPQSPSQPRNDRVDREKVAELAAQAEKAKRAQEERHRQEQVLLKQQQQKDRERQRQLADIRRQREALDRKLKREKQKLAQLQDLKNQKPAPAQQQTVPEADRPKSGSNGTDAGLRAQYQAAIQNAVTDNWLRPDSTQPGLHCMLRIVQIPGGDVISVKITNPCNADPLTRDSIEQAVKRAEPLPYKGYEKVFQREINFDFSYDG